MTRPEHPDKAWYRRYGGRWRQNRTESEPHPVPVPVPVEVPVEEQRPGLSIDPGPGPRLTGPRPERWSELFPAGSTPLWTKSEPGEGVA